MQIAGFLFLFGVLWRSVGAFVVRRQAKRDTAFLPAERQGFDNPALILCQSQSAVAATLNRGSLQNAFNITDSVRELGWWCLEFDVRAHPVP
jgi:hypothetical protein